VREGTDVLVIGGGPAGLAGAIAARQKGFEVTVADGAKPPIDKACGEGLMPSTMAALRELGVTIGPGDGQVFRGNSLRRRGHLGGSQLFRRQRVWRAADRAPPENGGNERKNAESICFGTRRLPAYAATAPS